MMILRPPLPSDEEVLRLAHRELELDGSNFLLDAYRNEDDFIEFLNRVNNTATGENLAVGRVQADFLVAEVEGEIVGRSSIRHSLNDWLFTYGGHIGYAVRPQFRRLGYASEILRQSLEVTRELAIHKVLMTCNDDNIGSIRVIEKHGGVLENKVMDGDALLRRYWIDLN